MTNWFITGQNQNMQTVVKEDVYKLLHILLSITRIKLHQFLTPDRFSSPFFRDRGGINFLVLRGSPQQYRNEGQ